jgi:hypothetical protein
MKFLNYRLIVLMLLLSGNAFGEEPNDSWVASIKKLFGTWESVSAEGGGDSTKFRFTFGMDGTISTKFTVGTFVDDKKGVYTVGRNHIYFWAEGPPTGVNVEDPKAHSQAMLMSYKFEGDTLKVVILDGSDRAILTLKKSTSEQAGTELPATRPESKSEGSDKTQSEAEARSH